MRKYKNKEIGQEIGQKQEEDEGNMGNLLSVWDEGKTHPPQATQKSHDSVSIKLGCADFGTFNGRSDHWITFKENTLSKAGVGGYAQYFSPDFIKTSANKEGNNRIFYLLQTATNGGGASHVVRRFTSTANGHEAWRALLASYEGPVMSGEIAKTLRTKLWALRLRSKDDVNKHINDFTLYMDQLKELGSEEREERLTDLFLDSIIDTKFEVTVANCRLRDHISIHECFEAIRKYDNIISRENKQGKGSRHKIRRLNNNIKQTSKHNDKSQVDTSYRSYAEWQKLSAEERSKVLEAREAKEKDKNVNKEEHNTGKQVESPRDDNQNKNNNGKQRNRRRTRRQVNSGNGNREDHEDNEQYQENEDDP